VVTDPDKAVAALNWVVAEMEQRYRRMSWLAVRNIDVFNNRVRQTQRRAEPSAGSAPETDLAPMAHIVVVVDEFADLMIVAGKEIEAAVQRLAQMARAAGIHLIMATQRPSVDIVTGTIKANFPTRISYKVASKFDSRTILNEQGAEQLLGQGDMLFANGMGRMLRVHGPFVSDDEVEGTAAYLRDQGEPRYVDGITDAADEMEPADEQARPAALAETDLYDRAVAIVRRDRKASTSYLQRRLLVGYNRAADLMERMEREGIVSAAGHNSRREVLIGRDRDAT
jgi:DNA segregation ATPase FtsK/SpoIIIE, S-DNA-T family